MRQPLDRMQRSTQQFLNVSGLQKVADGFTGIARSGLRVVESLTRIVPLLGAITGAASIAGIGRMVSMFSDWSAKLSHTATGLNVSSQRLQEYQNAIRLAGGSIDDMTESLKGLASSSHEALLGRDPIAAQTFARAGIALKDANGQLRDATELLPEAIEYVSRFGNAQDRAQIATQLGSRRIADLSEDFRRSGKPFNEWLKQAREQGVVSSLTQKQLLEYRQAMGKLSIAFENLGYAASGVIGGTLAPMLNDLANWVRTHQQEIHDFIQGFADGIKNWYQGGGLTRLLDTFDKLGKALKWMFDHADLIAGIFITKWGIEAVAAVAQLGLALNPVSITLAAMAASALAVWKLLHEGTGQPSTWTDPKGSNRFLDPSIPAMPAPGEPEWGGGVYTSPERPGVPPGTAPAPGFPGGEAGYNKTGNAYGFNLNRSRGGFVPGAGAGPQGAATGTLPQGAQEAISRAEGTWGPSGIDWNVQAGERPGQTSANLENMTIAEVAKLHGPDFGGLQINRVHLQPGSAALRALGIDPNTTKFTRDVQQRIGGFVHGQQGLSAWRGFIQHPEELQRAQQAIREAPAPGRAPAAPGVAPVTGEGAYGVPGAVMNYASKTGALGPPGTNLTTITTPSGKKVTVNVAAAEAFSGFLADLEKTGYKINSLGGFSNRGKAGGSGLSEHAFGNAIDINPGANPFRSDKTDLPANIHDMAAKWGLVWGGDWTSPKDTMHFQWGGSKPWMMAQNRPAPAPRQAEGAPANIAGGGKPANGEVNVTVTHKNPPAGASARAEAKGAGVNVGPVRTEWADMSAI